MPSISDPVGTLGSLPDLLELIKFGVPVAGVEVRGRWGQTGLVRIVVVGAGGVGGYFGARLAAAGQDVAVVARGPHLAAIRAGGLRVRSPLGDLTVAVPASDDPAEFGASDVVLFAVKAYDTERAAAGLAPLLGPDTAVVSLQNGIDNEGRIAAVVGAEHVVGGAAFIFASIAEPGVVVHTGGPARLEFGEVHGARTERVERLLQACRDAGVDADIPPDIHVVLWLKFAFICATAGMTAAVRLPLGEIRDCPESWAMFGRIVAEVVALGRAEGVRLPADAVDEQLRLAAAQPAGAYSSLHHDLVTGHRMELEALHGSVVRRAAQHGVPVPACEAVYGILRPWAARNGS
jgi:2-dehydropantoate 2-reductase